MSDVLPEHLALQLLPGECACIQHAFVFVKTVKVWDTLFMSTPAIGEVELISTFPWVLPTTDLSQRIMGCQCHHGTWMFLCGSIRRKNHLLSSSVPVLENILGCFQKEHLPFAASFSVIATMLDHGATSVWSHSSLAEMKPYTNSLPKNSIRFLLVHIQEQKT